MRTGERRRATAAARAVASSLGLTAEDATVLNDSNKLTLRLRPCDVLARVAPPTDRSAPFELRVAGALAAAGCPVAVPDPRVEPRAYERDGFTVTLWTYHEPVAPHGALAPADYADALHRLHAGTRGLDIPVPHFTERVAVARELVAKRTETPALADEDRELLADTLESTARAIAVRAAPEQPLHGEPHPGNLLATADGPLLIDLETVCRGPVEFDLAHAPEEVAAHYPGADGELLRECRLLVLAIITTWRYDRRDQLPDGRRLGEEWLSRIRTART
ncbi:phosphotransferase [Streptomyces sp. NPDC054784]